MEIQHTEVVEIPTQLMVTQLMEVMEVRYLFTGILAMGVVVKHIQGMVILYTGIKKIYE